MSEPGGGAIDVGTRRRGYKFQNQEEELYRTTSSVTFTPSSCF